MSRVMTIELAMDGSSYTKEARSVASSAREMASAQDTAAKSSENSRKALASIARISVGQRLGSINVSFRQLTRTLRRVPADARLAARGITRQVGIMAKSVGAGVATMLGSLKAFLRSQNALTDAVASGWAQIVAIVGGSLLAQQVFEVAGAYETMATSLRLATGSAENGQSAFAFLQEFAAETPFQLQSMVESFVLLQNLGIAPTEKRLISFGNTAASVGKSFRDFAEAVADAQTGEFERLKEFGIKASKQGDEIAFIFQGVETRVQASAAGIVGYLETIGDTQFAGAMAEQSQTLEGRVSTLKDAWTEFLFTVSQDVAFKQAVSLLSDIVLGANRLYKELGGLKGLWEILNAVTIRALADIYESFLRLAVGITRAMASVSKDFLKQGAIMAKSPLFSIMAKVVPGLDLLLGSLGQQVGQFARLADGAADSTADWAARQQDLVDGLRATADEREALAIELSNDMLRGATADLSFLNDELSDTVLGGKKAKKEVKEVVDGIRALRQELELARGQLELMQDFGLAAQDAAIALRALAEESKGGPISADAAQRIIDVVRALRETENLISATDYVRDLDQQNEVLREELAILDSLLASKIPYAEASRIAAVEAEAFARILEQGIDPASAMADEIRELTREEAGLIDQLERVGELERSWADMAGSIAGVLDSAFGGLDEGVSQVLRGIEQISAAWDGAQQPGNIGAAASLGQGIGSVLIGIGAGTGDQGYSQFGGRRDRDYADRGAELGAIVGSVVPFVGTAVGGLIGGLIGGAIKRGADEGIGKLQQVGDEVVLRITKDEAGLAGTISRIADAVGEGLDTIESLIGAELRGAADINVKIRGDDIEVWGAAYKQKFKEVEEAVAFIITKTIQDSDLSLAGPEFQAALRNTLGRSIEELEKDLTVALAVRDLRLGPARAALRKTIDGFFALIKEAEKLGIDASPVFSALATSMNDARASALGLQRSEEELIRERSAAFNAELALLEANLIAQKADAQARLAVLEVQRAGTEGAAAEALAKARGAEIGVQSSLIYAKGVAGAAETVVDVTRSQTEALVAGADVGARAMGGLAGSIGATALVALDSTNALRRALEQIDQALADLPGMISEAEIQDAIRRARNAAGAAGGFDARDFDSTFESSPADDAAEAIEILRRGLSDIAEGFYQSAAEIREMLDAASPEDRQLLVDDAVRGFLQSAGIGPTPAFDFGEGDIASQRAQLEQQWADQLEAARVFAEGLGATREEVAAIMDAIVGPLEAERDRQRRQLAEGAISSLGLPMEGARQSTRQMAETLEYLRLAVDEGTLSQERYAEAIAEVTDRARSEFLGLAADLLDQMGQTEMSAELRSKIAELEFQTSRMHLNFLYQQYLGLGLIGKDVAREWKEILDFINDENNWPDFTGAGPVDTGGPATGPTDNPYDWGALDPDRAADSAEDLRAELERLLDAWANPGPLTASDRLREITEQWERMLEIAEELGNLPEDLDAIGEAYQNQLAAFYEELHSGIVDLLDELTQGPLSGQSGRERVNDLVAEFMALSELAQAGDVDAIEQLGPLGRELIDLAQEVFGGTRGFTDIRDLVTSILGGLVGYEFPGDKEDETPGGGGGGSLDVDPVGGGGGSLPLDPLLGDAIPADPRMLSLLAEQTALATERAESQEDSERQVASLLQELIQEVRGLSRGGGVVRAEKIGRVSSKRGSLVGLSS